MSLSSLQQYHILDMLCMWEHVHWLYLDYTIVGVEQLKVTCLCSWIAADVHDALRCGKEYCVYDILMHTCSWWVGDDDIRSSVTVDKVSIEYIFHVTSIEQRVVYTIDMAIDLSIFYCLWHILYTYDLASLA